MDVNITVNQLKNKGKLVYEYNPLKNFRYQNDQGKIKAGQLTDLDTEKLNFSLEHPIDIQCQPSYDGSVNLILSDGINQERLINSRFSPRQNNTYEIVDRTGSNDTNIYDDSQFDLDTSLYKKVNYIPKIYFQGLAYGGVLPVGNYNFYFTYCDADGNETDFIGESGNIVCHIGNINDPKSIRGGLENEISGKTIQLYLTNLDTSYDYIKVYYTRQTSSARREPITEAKVLNKKFKTTGGACHVTIDGNETTSIISLEKINQTFFLASSCKTATQCKNRLFLANLETPSIDYQDFTDISLRIFPYYARTSQKDAIGQLDEHYSPTGGAMYYDVNNIYEKVGYWNEEIYRLGVVYILNDNSLSPVFNIRGRNEIPETSETIYSEEESILNETTGERNYISYNEETGLIDGKSHLENAKGVIRINDSSSDDSSQYHSYVYNLVLKISDEVKLYLKDTLKVKGLFFVRQKRIPNILTQAFVIGHDIISGIPLIPIKIDTTTSYKFESFVKDGILVNEYSERLLEINDATNEVALCPDYVVRQEFFNNFFTDTEFTIKEYNSQTSDILENDGNSERHYCSKQGTYYSGNNVWRNVPIIGVPDSVPIKRTRTTLFCSRAGSAESYDFKTVGEEFDLDYSNPPSSKDKIVRGAFGPYLGLSGYKGQACKVINIYVPNYQEGRMNKYFKSRFEDQSPFYTISDRMSIDDNIASTNVYRGDCYICQFTHRLNRNFQDLAAPTADTFVDEYCWKDNYRPETEPEKMSNINIGDLNAVRLGNWITFTVRSNYNLSMRNNDESYIEEALLTGNARSFYPLTQMSVDGNYKLPDAAVINTGISTQTSQKVNFLQNEVPYLKNCFQTRIAYSNISVTDAFKNGFRTFHEQAYRDYPTTYGGIMKILEVNDFILVIFEHGIGILPINERVLSGTGVGGDVFLNTNNVLPETLKMVTTDYGTQWPESVIKTPHGVYGVDTVAKKIWKFDLHGSIKIISDFSVQKFLNDNITLSEKELTPIIGVRNVKTHYNSFKKDVMFTFYDCKHGFEETVWNLCYNELKDTFITFYSWVPSYSENIDNIYFTFDRNTSKKIAKLESSKREGICVNSPVITNSLPILPTGMYCTRNGDLSIPSSIKSGDYHIKDYEGNNICYVKVQDGDWGFYNMYQGSPIDVQYESEIYTNIDGINYSKGIGKFQGLLFQSGSTWYVSEYNDNIGLFQFNSGSRYLGILNLVEGQEVDLIIDQELESEPTEYAHVEHRENSLGRHIYTFTMLNDGTLPIKIKRYSVIESINIKTYLLPSHNSALLNCTSIATPDSSVAGVFKDYSTTRLKIDGELPNTYYCQYTIEPSLFNAHKCFYFSPSALQNNTNTYLLFYSNMYSHITTILKTNQIIPLNITAQIYDNKNKITLIDTYRKQIYLTTTECLNKLTTSFWKHGQSGIIDIQEKIKPCHWYGEQHPFELEFAVNTSPDIQKTFDSLQIISNNAPPESFHYEIVGDGYDFSNDKLNMYVRQELTKELYQKNGSDIKYNENYKDLLEEVKQRDSYTVENYQLKLSNYKDKSTILPSYYTRIDNFNDVYDSYVRCTQPNNKNYSHLSGGEIIYEPGLKQFSICNHVQAIDVKDPLQGRLRGNMQYLQDQWYVQINPLNFVQKNEAAWNYYTKEGVNYYKVPINVYYPRLINDITQLRNPVLPEGYNINDIHGNTWGNRKEAKLKDKYMKIKIRYKGDKLALVSGVKILFRV